MKNQEFVISNQENGMYPNAIKTEKVDSDVAEIIVSESGEERDEIQVESQLESNTNLITEENKILYKRHLLKNSTLKGLLPPERDKWYLPISNVSVLKRCCIEHCYFALNRFGTFKYNYMNSLNKEKNTLQFENENRVEQQTIDLECLASEKEKSETVNDYKTVNEIRDLDLYQSGSNSSISDNEGSCVDDSNDRDYCPDDISTGSESENGIVSSDEGNDSLKQNQEKSLDSINSDLKNVFVKNESACIKRKRPITLRRVGITNYLTAKSTPKNFVSVDDILAQIKNMQKIVKAKCDKKYIGDTKKVPPPKLKRMLSRGRHEDFSKMSEFLFPMPSLTKMSIGSKNWKVDYTNDNVQSLGLDDLLLKASELNAENFTKALGRKLDPAKPIFSENESSEIVLTVPKANRMSMDGKQISESNGSDFIKKYGLKSIKLDISKPFFECEKKQENGAVTKSAEENSVKTVVKSAIKVKTVENINEEFKDSLELKNKILKNCSLEEINEKSNKGEGKHSSGNGLIERKDFVGSYDKEGKTQENLMDTDGEENKPFIMTIIQSKNEKQRPAILRNSSYFKKRTASLDGAKEIEKEKSTENKLPSKLSKEGSSEVKKVVENSTDSQCSKLQNLEKNICNESSNSDSIQSKTLNSDTYPKEVIETETEITTSGVDSVHNTAFSVKKKKIPFILNHKRKMLQSDAPTSPAQPKTSSNNVVKSSEVPGKIQTNDKVFKVTSVEQKLGPKEANKRFIKVVPYEPAKKTEPSKTAAPLSRNSDEDSEKTSSKDSKTSPLLSLTAFSTILREILPDKWFLCLDKKYGLQIIKTQVDEMLNPSILMSVVIGKCGKLTVNVRGKQLEKSHQFFANLCEMGNSENKLSLNYVLAVLNKLRYLSVCFGCDPSLKKYWRENESEKNQTNEFQQIYRSQLCHLLVSLGKKRCYPCYRMNESLKKRHKREKSGEKQKEDTSKDSSPVDTTPEACEDPEESPKMELHSRGVKRNLEDFLEDSFSTMRQQITNEIEKNKKLGEREKALKDQDEVLSFMGLTRKNSLGNPVRKSKRKKNSFYKLQQPEKKKIDQKELEFLEKYWSDINTLFSTSLLFGAYSRTGRGRLREKCKMFHKLLSTWKDIVKSNPEWIEGDVTLPYIRSVDDGSAEKNGTSDQFEKMDIPALRAYIINSVKEVNRIKHKLRTRNSYFKILYNKFVKRRMKRPKSPRPADENKKGKLSSAPSASTTPTPTNLSSDESSRDKGKTTDEESRPPNESTEVTANSDGY